MTITATTTRPAPDAPAAVQATEPADVGNWTDPREEIEYSVLLLNGRLAGRRFASREDAEAWADPSQGEEVIAFSAVCECAV